MPGERGEMKSRAYRKRLLLYFIGTVLFLLIQSISSFAADTVKYYYDDLNRLIRIEDTVKSKVIEYQYDEIGNRTSKISYVPHTITASAGANGSISPSGNVSVAYNANQSFTITPAAGYEILTVSVDGTVVGNPGSYTFSSVLANHAISASFTAYTYPVQIGSSYYATLQEAYNAAASGSTIKVKAKSLTESLSINRDINVSIEGGYDAAFSGIIGTTSLKGAIQTYAGGGTINIKNFALNNQRKQRDAVNFLTFREKRADYRSIS